MIHRSQVGQQLLLQARLLAQLASQCRPTASEDTLVRIGWVLYALTHCHDSYQRLDAAAMRLILRCLSVLVLYDHAGILRFALPCYCLLLWHEAHHALVLRHGVDAQSIEREMTTKHKADTRRVAHTINNFDVGDVPEVIGALIADFYTPFTTRQIQAMRFDKIERFCDLVTYRGGNCRVQRAAMGALAQLIRNGTVAMKEMEQRYKVTRKLSLVRSQTIRGLDETALAVQLVSVSAAQAADGGDEDRSAARCASISV